MPMNRTAEASIAKAKCDGCKRDMADDDDLYCRACHADVDSSARASVAQMIALTGKVTLAEAAGVLSAWKESAGEVAALRAQLAKQAEAAQASAFDAAIDAAKQGALLAPDDSHKRNKVALSFKGKPGAQESLASFLAALDPLVPTGQAAAHEPAPDGVAPRTEASVFTVTLDAKEKALEKERGLQYDGAKVELSQEDKVTAKSFGLSVEQYAKQKAYNRAAIAENGPNARRARAGKNTDKEAAE